MIKKLEIDQDACRLALRYLMADRGWSTKDVSKHTRIGQSVLASFLPGLCSSSGKNLTEVALRKLIEGFGYDSLQAFFDAANEAAQKCVPRVENQDCYRRALRYLMDERNWGCKEVANNAEVNLGTLRQFVSERHNYSNAMLIKLVNGFGYDSLQAFLEAGDKAAQKFKGLEKSLDDFRRALNICMKEKGWNLKDVANNTGLNAGTLRQFLGAQCVMSPAFLLKLAEGFGYDSTQAFVSCEKTVFQKFPQGVLHAALKRFLEETKLSAHTLAQDSIRPLAEVNQFLETGGACNYQILQAVLRHAKKDTPGDFVVSYTPEGKVLEYLKRQLAVSDFATQR